MIKGSSILASCISAATAFSSLANAENLLCTNGTAPFTIAIHGGLGETQYSAELQKTRKELMHAVLTQARDALAKGALAIDVVAIAVAALEESGLFDAGKGSVDNVAGEITLDASIMDGRDKSAGAVANFKTLKNPIYGARAAMKAGQRFFVGPDAENFSPDLEHVDATYFIHTDKNTQKKTAQPKHNSGTVGAVALDRCGNLAAATSTGGYPDKPVGRVGDSPLIGAATFAENGVCAVSTTGEGEYFIRTSAAHEVCAQIKYAHKEISAAAHDVIENQVGKLGGNGGLIAIDGKGNVAWPFRKAEWGLLRGIAQKTEIRIGVFEKFETSQ